MQPVAPPTVVEPVTLALPPEDRPPGPDPRALASRDRLDFALFAVIGALGVLGLVFQAVVMANGRDDVWLGVIGGALCGIWVAANKADTSKWQANTGPADRSTP